MKKIIIIVTVVLSCLHLLGCNPSEKEKYEHNRYLENLSIGQNIARETTPIYDLAKLDFLDSIATRKIILLGEQEHFDLTTSMVKVQMIQYLTNKGFTSIALESAPFLTSYIFGHPKFAHLTETWRLEDFWAPIWTMQETCAPLINMINNKEIKVWGIDVHLGKYDIQSVEIIILQYTNTSSFNINWNKLETLFLRKFIKQDTSISEQDEFLLMDYINQISIEVEYLISTKGQTEDLLVLLQWIRNVNTYFSYVVHNKGTKITDSMKFVYRNRDNQMAENIIWIVNNFTNEKLIIWCANFHGAKDISQTTYPKDSTLYFVHQCMAESIYNKLRKDFYTIAFTSFNTYYTHSKQYISTDSELEVAIKEKLIDVPYGFINFEQLRSCPKLYNQSFQSNFIGKKDGRWLYIYDGVFYIKDQISNKYLVKINDMF